MYVDWGPFIPALNRKSERLDRSLARCVGRSIQRSGKATSRPSVDGRRTQERPIFQRSVAVGARPGS